MRNAILSLILITAIAGCRPLSLYGIKPQGTPEYKLGWEDGCDTGLGSVAGGINKYAFGFRKRPEFASNELYNTAWNEGFSYCRWSQGAVDRDIWSN